MTRLALPAAWLKVPGLAWVGNACRYVLASNSLLSVRMASTMLPGFETAAVWPDSHASLLPAANWLTTPGGIILFLNRSVYAFTPAIFCGVLTVGVPSLSKRRPPKDHMNWRQLPTQSASVIWPSKA